MLAKFPACVVHIHTLPGLHTAVVRVRILTRSLTSSLITNVKYSYLTAGRLPSCELDSLHLASLSELWPELLTFVSSR